MKIADGELRQLLTYDVKLPAETVRDLVADSKQTGHSLMQTVLASKVIDETPLAQAQAKRLGVPFIDLETTPISAKHLHRLPLQIATKYHLICFDETATSIKVAMADPRDERARKAVKDYCNKTIRRYQATDRGLTKAMRSYTKTATPLHFSTRDLISTIIEQALNSGSSDIHFEPQGKELVIKRRDGKRLQVMSTLPASRLRGLIGWCKVQTGNDVGDTERPHNGRFSIRIDGALHDVIMSTIPVIEGEKMVLRLVPPAHSIPSLEAMGYGAKEQATLADYISDGRGLIIIAGGNDAGVSTTLASLTKLVAGRQNTSVTSIEDSLTYQIPDSTQVEATPTLPFSDIVSSVVTQNPNVIVASRLGKGKVAEQLVDFSLSQHLVISGIYATSLSTALTHLLHYPIAPALMAASLRLVIVQHLLEKLCSKCRISFKPSGPLKKVLWEQFDLNNDTLLFRQGPGCASCSKGLNGTVMATEWLPVTHELQQLLATKADTKTISNYLGRHSDYTRRLGKLASKGHISIDEAIKRAAE